MACPGPDFACRGLTWPVVPQWMPEGYALEEPIVDDVVQRELLFHACYPLSKEEFNAVLALYETFVELGQYPNHGYRTDDGRIVRRAYCYGIIHTRCELY